MAIKSLYCSIILRKDIWSDCCDSIKSHSLRAWCPAWRNLGSVGFNFNSWCHCCGLSVRFSMRLSYGESLSLRRYGRGCNCNCFCFSYNCGARAPWRNDGLSVGLNDSNLWAFWAYLWSQGLSSGFGHLEGLSMYSLSSCISLNLNDWSLHNKCRMRSGLYCCVSFLSSMNSFGQSDSRCVSDLFGLNHWSDCTEINYGCCCRDWCPCWSDFGLVALSHYFWCHCNLSTNFSSRLSQSVCFLLRFRGWESHSDSLGLCQNLRGMRPRWHDGFSKRYHLCLMDTTVSLWLFSAANFRRLIFSVYVR